MDVIAVVMQMKHEMDVAEWREEHRSASWGLRKEFHGLYYIQRLMQFP
jgi:hypothetical protein